MWFTLIKIAIFCLIIAVVLRALKIVYISTALFKWLVLLGAVIALLALAKAYVGVF